MQSSFNLSVFQSYLEYLDQPPNLSKIQKNGNKTKQSSILRVAYKEETTAN
jgi:hypothetical protein